MAKWRKVTDLMKHSGLALRAADWMGRGKGRWRWLDHLSAPPPAPLKPDLKNWESHELAAVWIGHATVLLRMGGKTILTDPVLANRIGIGLGFMTGGPMRRYAAALNHRQLPKLDLILLSHAHYDHWDRPTLVKLDKNVPVMIPHHTRDLIRDLGFRHLKEMKVGESFDLKNLKISACEVKHWGARTFFDLHRGYCSYLLESKKHRVLFAGDCAFFDGFKPLAPVDLAILGIGSYNPYVLAHANPEQAWEMFQHLQARWLLPMHHSTFKLSVEPAHEPMERLLAVARGQTKKIIIQKIGQTWVGE